MKGVAFVALLLFTGIAVTGCRPGYGYHGHRGPHEMDDREAWEIVRHDPCRYDEYQRFAAKHKNPERRRDVIWRLARDGCSQGRAYDYDSDR